MFKEMLNDQFSGTLSKLREFINNDYVIVIICWIVGFSPSLIAWGLWAWLDPTGFWQKTVIVVIYCSSFFP